MKKYIPNRGDVVWTDFDPAAGHEQMGKRPTLVLSPKAFNKTVQLAMVAPITSRIRGHAFEVPLVGKKITGVALCHQVKMIDFVARGVQFAENAQDEVVSEVLAKVRAIISETE
ncbi:type II toxin-antitoxin system PemK/MazF family toxin [Desulfobulbus oligotrophicus]|jgi:mRNA interferase MazF|uniref:Type II toxin-antitoxin system PemK/MazF family toxin n=1 Tax=Desulfobulbus oligotrophicus TaxID=1909699 RepID=A0A7T6APL0_9BACT|nr:type II toxin-antitoxin system PemK/MazF family toxin [Desulfobulbus oligotrophicus]MDY0390470.1 type II toxin-antitoxin system PemK/MazF family toxin [Desulfobulbus oligotrophicus]QQG64763.1 type II toxin-antitoxin system PemK/MazF family toxin [Desulfobulbus oligotrophicus]